MLTDTYVFMTFNLYTVECRWNNTTYTLSIYQLCHTISGAMTDEKCVLHDNKVKGDTCPETVHDILKVGAIYATICVYIEF